MDECIYNLEGYIYYVFYFLGYKKMMLMKYNIDIEIICF